MLRARVLVIAAACLGFLGLALVVPTTAQAGAGDPVVVDLPHDLRALPRGVYPLGRTDDGHTVFDYELDPAYKAGGLGSHRVVAADGTVSVLGDDDVVQSVVGNRLVQAPTDTTVKSRLIDASSWTTQTVPSGYKILDYTVDGIVVATGAAGSQQLGVLPWGSSTVLALAGVPAGTTGYGYVHPVHNKSYSVLSAGGNASGDKLVLDTAALKAWVLPATNPDCPTGGYQGLAVNEGVLAWMTQLPSNGWVLCTTNLPAPADAQVAATTDRPMTRLPDGIVTGNTDYQLLPVGSDVVVAASDAYRDWGKPNGEPVLATAPDGTTRTLATSGHSIIAGTAGHVLVVTGSAPGQASLRNLDVAAGSSVEAMPISPVNAWYSGISIDGTKVAYADDSAALGGARVRTVDFGAATAGPSTLLDEDVQAPVAVGQGVTAWGKSGYQGKYSTVLLGDGTRITSNSYQPQLAEAGWVRFNGQLMKLPAGTTSNLANLTAFQDGVTYQSGATVSAAANAVVATDVVTGQTKTIPVPQCTKIGDLQVAGSWLMGTCPDGPTAYKFWVVDRAGVTPTRAIASGGSVFLGNGFAVQEIGGALSWTSLADSSITWKPLGNASTSNDEAPYAVAVSRGSTPSVAWFSGRSAHAALLPVTTSALPTHPGVLSAPPAPTNLQVTVTPATGAATVSWSWSSAADAETAASFSVDSGDVHLTGLSANARSASLGVPAAGSRSVVVTAVGASTSTSAQLASFTFPGAPQPLDAPPAPSGISVSVTPSTGAATVHWTWAAASGAEPAASFSVDSGTVHLTGLSASARSASLGVPAAGSRSVVVTAVGASKSTAGQLASFAFPGAPLPPPVISNVKAPTISGTPRVGRPLTASTGTWTPAASYRYQWFAGNSPISNATKASYTPTPGVLAKRLRVEVTATKAGYTSATWSSALTAAVAPGTLTCTTPPTVSGTKQAGRTLAAAPGKWSPTGLTYRYQWLRDGVAISGATKSSYKLTAASKGHRISVRVTASRTGYKSVAKDSATVKIAK